MFRCEGQCGFTGSNDEVAAHEATCSFVIKTSRPESGAISKSTATNKPEASPPSSATNNAPCEKEEGWTTFGVCYRCDGECGFSGTFVEVATHQLTCSAHLQRATLPAEVPAALQAAQAQAYCASGRHETRYACDGNCGFTGTFHEVVVHEATCPACPRRRAARRRSPIFPLAHCWQSRTTTTSPIVNFCCAIWLICLVAAFVGVMVACSQQTECFSRSRGVKSGQGAGLGMV